LAIALVGELGAFTLLSTSASTAAQVGAHQTGNAALTAQVAAPASRAVKEAATSTVSREVFGFGLASSLGDPSIGYPSWDFSLLSTVAFFGLHINWDGTIVADSGWTVWNSGTLSGLVSTAHAHGTKVVVTIVLQDFQAGTPNMCAGLINRATTVSQTVAQVVAKGVDGVNVDYEGLNGTCQNGQTSQSMMTDFVRRLRAALPVGSYLSVDAYASSASDTLGFFDIRGMSPYVDAYFVMAYDLEYSNYLRSPTTCTGFCLGPTAPLTGYYYNDTSAASQYLAAVPASKIILGVPYYGRKACVSAAEPNAYPTGSVVADSYLDASGEAGASAVQAGTYVAHRDANDPAGLERWDTWYNPSLGCTRELYWDDATSLDAKYDLVNQDGLRGVGIWTLNYGGAAPELWAALASRFARCATAGLTPAKPAQPAGSDIAFAASSTGCATPQYEYWIQYPGGAWSLKRGWGGAAFTWNTGGLAPGVYTVHAWASSSGTVRDAIGEATVTLTGCTSASVTPATASAQIGSVVSLVAGAGGCPNPTYEFWLQYPSGRWVLLQQWGGPTLNWNTTAMAPGTYTIHAWAGQQGAAQTLEVYAATSLTLFNCTTAALSPATASHPAGSTIGFTASANGCVGPQYEFWVQYPGGAWYLEQPWGGPTFSWATTSLAPGVYTVHAWVNHTGATTWDSIGSSTVTLTGCTAASTTPSSSAAQVGSVFSLVASSSGCPDPTYEFWLQYPNGRWVLLQQWGGSTFNWNTAGMGPGTYTIHAWANQQGAAPTLEVYGSTTLTLYSPCTAASISPASGSSTPGTTVKFTASASGCQTPMYEFWLLDPSGTWHLMLAFGNGPTWTWNTSGWARGKYTVHAWADQWGTDPTLHEAIGAATFTST